MARQMLEASWVERLGQFSNGDNARFFLLTDAKMDSIAYGEAMHESWIRHAEGHFHLAHEIAGGPDGLMI
jgi:hypothetical protein